MTEIKGYQDNGIKNRDANWPINIAKFERMLFEENKRNKRERGANEMIKKHLVGEKQNNVAVFEHRCKNKNNDKESHG